MKRKSVSIEEVLEWHTLNLKGMLIKDICKKYKRDFKTIKSWFSKYNISYCSRVYENPNIIYPIYKEYNKGFKSLKQLSKEYNIHVNTILRGWKYFNLEYVIDFKRNKGNNPNHSFFKEISTEIQAYLLGFFAGDGHIEKRKDYDSYCLKVSLNKKDRYILELFNKYIGNNQYNISELKSGLLSISITSKSIGEDLYNLGYDNRKTYTSKKIPSIPKELIRHFIRGYFDADGCISKYTISFASYNKELLLNIIQVLPRISRFKLNFRTTDNICGFKCKASGWTLEISEKNYLPFIYRYLYKDTNYFLQRKKERFSINKNCSLA